MPGYTLDNLGITETFYGWFTKTNDIIAQLNSVSGQGVSAAGISGDNLIITLIDGSTFDAGSAIGPTGDGVAGAAITNGELIFTLDSGIAINVGNVVGPTGLTGSTGDVGATGGIGITGPTGAGVPDGGNVGYALVKASNTNQDTEWSDITSLSKSNPGQIGGFEAGTGDLIFGAGISGETYGRDLYPRWSVNYYLSEVHNGGGIAMAGATGLYAVAGEMSGFTFGYDDGLTAGIKVLNFLESTKLFESNKFTRGACTGETLDGPPGYYWNRMKYFPTVKLQPIYVANFCVVDKYMAYITGYESGATANINANIPRRRGTYGWFGMIPVNGFPVGTPESEVRDYNGFVEGSTCTYFFRPADATLHADGLAVSVSNSNYEVSGVAGISYTGGDIREVTPGRTGPIGLYSSAAGREGIDGGFTLSPGWYYIASEIIPAAWFSVGSVYDPISEGDAYMKGFSADHVLFTHTDASTNQGSSNLFGLNGFELAPAGVETGVGTAFTPSAYLGIASITAGMKTLPTGLPAHLWYSQGKSGASASGRFGDNGTSQFLSANIGLHPIDESVDTEGGITIRAQNAQQASAPRIAISVISSASSFDTLRPLTPPAAEQQDPDACEFFWNGNVNDLSPSTSNAYSGDFTEPLDGIPWLQALFGASTNWVTSGVTGVTFTSAKCPDGTCPEFLAPPHHGGTYGVVGQTEDPGLGGFDAAHFINPAGLTTAGITGSTADGFIHISGTGGATYYFGFGLNVPLGWYAPTPVEGCTQGYTGAYGSPADGIGLASIPPEGSSGFPTSGINASISIFVNAQEDLHKKWFGTVSGSEKNHLVYYTGTFGCSADGGYPTYTGP
jgi:hypothetical protein